MVVVVVGFPALVLVDPDVATAMTGDALAPLGSPLTMPVEALLFG